MRYPGENSAGRTPGRRQNPSGRTTPPEERTAASKVSAGSKSTGGGAALFAPGYSGSGGAAREPVPAGGGLYGAGGSAAGKGPIRGFPPAPGQPAPLYPPGPFSAWNRTSGQPGNGHNGATSDVWLAIRDPQAPEPGYAPAVGAGAAAAFADGGSSDAGYSDTGYPDAGYSDAGYPGAGPAESGAPAGTEQFAVPGFADHEYRDPGYAALAVSDPAADVTSTQSWNAVDAPGSGWSDLSTADDQWSRPQPRQGSASGLATPPGADTSPGGAGVLPPGSTPPAGLARAPHGDHEDRHQAGGPPGPFDRAAAGPFDRGATGPGARAATGPSQRAATGPSQRAGAGPGDRAPGGRGRGTRGRSRPAGGGRRLRTLLICGLALIVVVGATYFWFARGGKHPAAAIGSAHAKSRPSPTDPSPTPSLGPWGHITTRALDPVPLTLAELFPGQFSNAGINYVRTAAKAKLPHCASALIGSGLIAAVSKAGCTQALRASYLSSNRKLMGTIGVLNLITTAAADKAGKATGPTEFIAQLPGAHGLTRFLTKGTGFEAAEIKGHYLVLVWAEFANQRAPKTAGQKAQLSGFISLLMQQTANVALANRMVTGSPAPSPPT
ncbi:MAG TPA: hypothetical protein VMC03_09200 [Streptosporangiaceae bacterium]|nr:hypothetical protein [Streptosporangiaceae bacterium]